MKRKISILGCTILAAVALTACGGSSEAKSTTVLENTTQTEEISTLKIDISTSEMSIKREKVEASDEVLEKVIKLIGTDWHEENSELSLDSLQLTDEQKDEVQAMADGFFRTDFKYDKSTNKLTFLYTISMEITFDENSIKKVEKIK